MSLTESIVEAAALEWFGELGYAVGHGPQIAPGEAAAERDAFGEVVLVGRLRVALRQINFTSPEGAKTSLSRWSCHAQNGCQKRRTCASVLSGRVVPSALVR